MNPPARLTLFVSSLSLTWKSESARISPDGLQPELYTRVAESPAPRLLNV